MSLDTKIEGYIDTETNRVAIQAAKYQDSDLNGDAPAYWYSTESAAHGLDPWRIIDGIDKHTHGDGYTIWLSNGATREVKGDHIIYVAEKHYDFLMEAHNAIVKIEFFPDYCSDGVWITRKGATIHGAGTLEEIQRSLNIEFPRWFVNKIETMQRFYDIFCEPFEEDFHEKYGIFSHHMVDIDMLEHIILTDFKRLYPQHAHLVAYSNGNKYHLESNH